MADTPHLICKVIQFPTSLLYIRMFQQTIIFKRVQSLAEIIFYFRLRVNRACDGFNGVNAFANRIRVFSRSEKIGCILQMGCRTVHARFSGCFDGLLSCFALLFAAAWKELKWLL